MTWEGGRPVFGRLPVKGYQDNLPTDWITRWVDEILIEKKAQLEAFYTLLTAETSPVDYLDYLAFLVGYSGDYWVNTWSSEVKRLLIAQSNELWSYKGTFKAVIAVLDIHLPAFSCIDGDGSVLTDGDGISLLQGDYTIWTDEALRLPFTLSGLLGIDEHRFYVLLSPRYERKSYGFIEAQRTLRNYAPATVLSGVAYDRFYTGFSVIGDPIF